MFFSAYFQTQFAQHNFPTMRRMHLNPAYIFYIPPCMFHGHIYLPHPTNLSTRHAPPHSQMPTQILLHFLVLRHCSRTPCNLKQFDANTFVVTKRFRHHIYPYQFVPYTIHPPPHVMHHRFFLQLNRTNFQTHPHHQNYFPMPPTKICVGPHWILFFSVQKILRHHLFSNHIRARH